MYTIGNLCLSFGAIAILLGCLINPVGVIVGIVLLVLGCLFLIAYNVSPQAKADWEELGRKTRAAHEEALRRQVEKRELREYHRQCRQAKK